MIMPNVEITIETNLRDLEEKLKKIAKATERHSTVKINVIISPQASKVI